jgi:multicomponent Na+:H+ antiporter subunit B
MREDVVIRTVSRIAVPFIQLFALYTIIHGTTGAGGGFQGGVIFASSFILFGIAFGVAEAKGRFGEMPITLMSSTGVLLFALIGLLCLVLGGNYLDYGVIPLPLAPAEVRSVMAEAVEIGIGITVLAVIVSIFYDVTAAEDET